MNFSHFRDEKTDIVFLLYVCIVLERSSNAEDNGTESKLHWIEIGKRELTDALAVNDDNLKVAKNVILFVGAGMSTSTISAARLLKHRTIKEVNLHRKETKLAMDELTHIALSRTYPANNEAPDSASTATAYLGGVKTNPGSVGVTSDVPKGDCESSSMEQHQVRSVFRDAYDQGKWLGIVTDVSVTHASAAAAYAHAPSEFFHSDADIPSYKKEACQDVAKQFINASHLFRVVLGGGRKYFTSSTVFDPEYQRQMNSRKDGIDMIALWRKKLIRFHEKAQYVWNRKQFKDIDSSSIAFLLGLFEPEKMHYENERTLDKAGEPSLAEMTRKAILILNRSDEGFLLLVHAGRIDDALKTGNISTALENIIALDDAVGIALDITKKEETLIIVTANHGPSSFLKEAESFSIETDLFSDVVVRATGPRSHIFHGLHEQVYIATAIRYAACLDQSLCLLKSPTATNVLPDKPLDVFGMKWPPYKVERILRILYVFIALLLGTIVCLVLVKVINITLKHLQTRIENKKKKPVSEQIYYDPYEEPYVELITGRGEGNIFSQLKHALAARKTLSVRKEKNKKAYKEAGSGTEVNQLLSQLYGTQSPLEEKDVANSNKTVSSTAIAATNQKQAKRYPATNASYSSESESSEED